MFKALILSISLLANTIGLSSVATKIEQSQIQPSPTPTSAWTTILSKLPVPKPIPTLSNKDQLSVQAQSYILFDPKSATVLAEKNSRSKKPYASIAKLLTALIIAEKGGGDSVITISHNAASQTGSIMGLHENEQITVTNLLYGLMLNSGNDAAVALAEWHSSTVANFVVTMNKRATELGLSDSHFADPAGLDELNTITSAYDVAKLLSYDLTNTTVAGLIKTKEMTVSDTTGKIKHTLQNSDKLIANDYAGILGGKTGTGTFGSYKTDAGTTITGAGHCLAVAADKNSTRLIAVVGATYLNTHDASANEAQKLLDFGFSHISYNSR